MVPYAQVAEIEDLSGRTLGEFVLRERIGEGGYGAVYRCEQPLLGREAVVKVLHPRLRRNDAVLQRFMREAQLASRLDHPYAAHVYAFGVERDDGLLWIAMEMVQGTALSRWLQDHGPLPLDRFVPFFEHLAEVVHAAHERGIVHRDLKPSNVMVVERGGRLLPKLLDFAVAKLLDGARPLSTRTATQRPHIGAESLGNPAEATQRAPREAVTLTANTLPDSHARRWIHIESMVGSPPYMSPEQWRNAFEVGPASDLYSPAVVAYEALTGRCPLLLVTCPSTRRCTARLRCLLSVSGCHAGSMASSSVRWPSDRSSAGQAHWSWRERCAPSGLRRARWVRQRASRWRALIRAAMNLHRTWACRHTPQAMRRGSSGAKSRSRRSWGGCSCGRCRSWSARRAWARARSSKPGWCRRCPMRFDDASGDLVEQDQRCGL